jgi:hypothetical protein
MVRFGLSEQLDPDPAPVPDSGRRTRAYPPARPAPSRGMAGSGLAGVALRADQLVSAITYPGRRRRRATPRPQNLRGAAPPLAPKMRHNFARERYRSISESHKSS